MVAFAPREAFSIWVDRPKVNMADTAFNHAVVWGGWVQWASEPQMRQQEFAVRCRILPKPEDVAGYDLVPPVVNCLYVVEDWC